MKNFANFCREHYHNLDVSLEDINKFEKDYDRRISPVEWYTKNRFIYSTLNCALRTQNIELILLMGFFVQDLHCQLLVLEMNSEQRPEMIVYRGQSIPIDELENMKNSKNNLLSFNNFLATSKDQDVSYRVWLWV